MKRYELRIEIQIPDRRPFEHTSLWTKGILLIFLSLLPPCRSVIPYLIHPGRIFFRRIEMRVTKRTVTPIVEVAYCVAY
jgi:hypothetical protein